MIQALADVSIVRLLPPSVFWPRPQVDSAVVRIRPECRSKRAAVGDVAWFHEIVRAGVLPPPQVHPARAGRGTGATLEQGRGRSLARTVGINGQLRAESLNVDQFLVLARALREREGDASGHRRANPDQFDADNQPGDLDQG